MKKTATQILEDQILEEHSRAISNAIDFEVLCNLLVEACGWIKVELDTLGSNNKAVDMNNWLHTECTKHWKRNGRIFIFESKNEAALFKLTWL